MKKQVPASDLLFMTVMRSATCEVCRMADTESNARRMKGLRRDHLWLDRTISLNPHT